MSRIFGYYHRFQDVRGNLTGLPGWARTIVMIFALPGIVLVALSITALIASVAVLLLLTVPVYSMLRTVTSGGRADVSRETDFPGFSPGSAKQINAVVRDAHPDEAPRDEGAEDGFSSPPANGTM